MSNTFVKGLAIAANVLAIGNLLAADVELRVPLTFQSGGQIEQHCKSFMTEEINGLTLGEVIAGLTYSLESGGPDEVEPSPRSTCGLNNSLAMTGAWEADVWWWEWYNELFPIGDGSRYSSWPAVSFNFVVPSNSCHWIAAEDPQGHIIAVNVAGVSTGTYVACSWQNTNSLTKWPHTVAGHIALGATGDSRSEIYGPFSLWGYTGPDSPADTKRPQGKLAIRADPFNAINGNVQRDETDIAIPALGMPLVFSRSYNSVDTNDASFGIGWRASTDWTLSQQSDSSVQIQTDEGRVFSFSGDGTNWFCNVDVRWHVCTDTNGGWILDGRDGGGTLRFDTNGLLSSTADGWGNSITALRDTSGHITNISHSCGLSLGISWTNNLISAVVGPDSILRADYFYNSSGLLTGVVRSASSGQTISRSYFYDPSTSLMTNTVNVIGQKLIYQYATQDDGSVRCTSSAFSDGSFAGNATWEPSNWLTKVEYPVSTEKSRTEKIRWIPTVSRMSWVEIGGQKLDYYYDPTFLSITGLSWQAGDKTAAFWSTLDSGGRPVAEVSVCTGKVGSTWVTEWQTNLDLPASTVDPLGWRKEYTWTNGLLASLSSTNGNGGWLTTSLTYSQGLLTAISDPLSRTSLFQYDSQGNLACAIPPVGPLVTLTNDLLGNVVSVSLPSQDGTGRTWVLQRDGFGNLTNALAPDGIAVQGYYDAIGNLTGLVDRAGRQLNITYGIASTPLSISRTINDNGSNRTVTLATSRDLQMDPTAVIDPLGRKVEAYIRDDAGRVSIITNVEGNVATVQYGAADLPLSVTRFDGTVNTFNYNGDWLVTSSVLPARTNTFSWLANGLLASVGKEQATVTNNWIAPGWGWLTSQETQTPSWTGHVDYACDLSGAITQTTASAIGLSLSKQFDGGGRETNRIQTCNGIQLSSERGYGSWNGLPTSVKTGPIQETLGWDILDQLTNLTWQAGTSTVRQIDFQRNVLGQITQRVDRVAGNIVAVHSYSYDDLDRLIGEAVFSGRFAEYGYDDAGRRTVKNTSEFGVNYSNGTGDRLAGWSVSRTSLTISVSGTASKTIGTNTQFGFRQVYNGAGSAAPVINGSNFTATLQAEPLGTQTVVALISDLAGNVGVATNRFVWTAYTTGAYANDDAGCVTQIVYQGPICQQSKVLSWDAEYRLTSVKTNGATAESYGLDPFGRRISTTANDDSVTRFLNDGQHVLADLDATGGVLRTYLYGPNTDELLAMTVYTGAVAQTYYTIRDHQNTVWAMTDTNGAVVESYDFDAWGRVLSVTDSNGNTLAKSAIGNRYLFQGREYSWATGLYYFRARWYDPVAGRWLSPDPIGISGGLNQYVFCANNPVNFTDPYGLCSGQSSDANYNYWDRYAQYLDKYAFNPKWFATALSAGLWPKSWAFQTGGRPPAAGSDNWVTSFIRGVLVKGARSNLIRYPAMGIGVATMGAGFWNVGIYAGGFFAARDPASYQNSGDEMFLESTPP